MIDCPTIKRISRESGKVHVQFSDKHGMTFDSPQAMREDVREWLADFRNLRMLALAVALEKGRGGDERAIAEFTLRIDPEKA